MVSWLEVFLMILFVAALADAATRRNKSSPNSQAEGERKTIFMSGKAAMDRSTATSRR